MSKEMEGDTLQDLLEQYKETRRYCRKMAEKTETGEDRTQWNGMRNHADFVIRWLETGREPGNMRGIERRAVYQREIPVDPHRFPLNPSDGNRRRCHDGIRRQVYTGYEQAEWEDDREDREMAEEDEETIRLFLEEVLGILSDREREVWEMYHVGMMEQDEIAEVLGITQQRVSALFNRAERKMEDWRKL
ncbi:sigma-70 family RNA polymerase sigma factor [Kroppenstedtia guangzhouensis]|uniref:sigma-70 family RNA polymerase sigma factor n=1 Tax=Kroppenstedtia guangzhouensis TaxID=1274356 RepID=UPI0016694FCE|nr:sigma-70 family RNA polymerase sigma factor [Kroppenstedtia guangzhouensis]